MRRMRFVFVESLIIGSTGGNEINEMIKSAQNELKNVVPRPGVTVVGVVVNVVR